MVRRIVRCNTCRKRFVTNTGSTLCLACRPREVPPELTYGGSSLDLTPKDDNKRKRRRGDCGGGGEQNTSHAHSNDSIAEAETSHSDGNFISKNNHEGQHCTTTSVRDKETTTGPVGTLTTTTNDNGSGWGKETGSTKVNTRKRKHSPYIEGPNNSKVNGSDIEGGSFTYGHYEDDQAAVLNASPSTIAIEDHSKCTNKQMLGAMPVVSVMNHCEDTSTVRDCSIHTNRSDVTIHTNAPKQTQPPPATNKGGESEGAYAENGTSESIEPLVATDPACERLHASSFEDETNRSIKRRLPKVSIGSVDNDNCYSEEGSDGDMDALIAQDSMWGTSFKSDSAVTKKDESDDSDIECVGVSSKSFTEKQQAMNKGNRCNSNLHGIGGEVNSEIGSLGSFECQPKDADRELPPCTDAIKLCNSVADDGGPDSASPPEQHSSPAKDICYICGLDLSRLKTGLRGRVAHMKRCSAKFGQVLGGREAMNNDGGYDADFVDADMEETTLNARPKEFSVGVSNPYDKNRWHEGASTELELNKPMSTPKGAQPKQTLLQSFFEAPKRSLTSVLLAGAKQMGKGKAIMAASKKGIARATSGNQSKSYRKGRWQSNNRRSGNCPSYKRIPGTDFIVDGFHYARRALSEMYFLTHFHSDHYGGIGKTWSEGTIYCSLPTANLVHGQLGVEKSYLHPLPMNTPTVIASKGKPITVTLLNANHCPGAIMFLFEVGQRKILHVGDFRWHRQLMMQMPQLRAFNNASPRLDELFLDTTYCDKKYELPTQEEAINAAIAVAEQEMAKSKKDIKMKTLFLFGSYTIGKERIYLAVAEKLKMKVFVDSRRYRILSSLEWPSERMNMFTKDKSETSIWVVPLGSVNFKLMKDYLDESNKNKAFTAPYGRAVGFRPTGWTFKASGKKQRTLPGCSRPERNLISSKTSGKYTVHGVPYSEHSSFPELVDCLRCLKPKKITPTVSVSKSAEQVELLLSTVNT